jgi:hypothetical protein
MAKVNNEAVRAGWMNGEDRVRAERISPAELESDGFSLLSRVIDNWNGDLQDRFVALLAENVAVATAVREAMGEAPLGENDIWTYLEIQVWFMNSWNHP